MLTAVRRAIRVQQLRSWLPVMHARTIGTSFVPGRDVWRVAERPGEGGDSHGERAEFDEDHEDYVQKEVSVHDRQYIRHLNAEQTVQSQEEDYNTGAADTAPTACWGRDVYPPSQADEVASATSALMRDTEIAIEEEDAEEARRASADDVDRDEGGGGGRSGEGQDDEGDEAPQQPFRQPAFKPKQKDEKSK